MIWLSFRRHRTNLIVAVVLALALCGWMALVAHWFETATMSAIRQPGGAIEHYQDLSQGPTIFRLPYQADAIDLLLLAFPCLLGVLLGVPLVAGELDDHTNRLAWTQRISRTRWLCTKWWVVGLPLMVLTVLVSLAAQWWFHHVAIQGPGSFLESFSGLSRMEPQQFSVTGMVPVACTVFAFSLGAALGALLRRVSWSILGTLVLYAIVSLVMVTTVRPVLAPQTFVPFTSDGAGFSSLAVPSVGGPPWYIGEGYRFVPGSNHPADPTAARVGLLCQNENVNLEGAYARCLVSHHLQEGQFFQPATNYWTIQWRESLIYLVASACLFALGLRLVRRWRA
jgi:hypothetical protein